MHTIITQKGTVPTGLGPIADLEALYVGGNINLSGTQPVNAVSQQAQFWIEGLSDRGPVYDLPADVDFLEGNVLNTRVRSLNVAGEVSPWSNIARFAAFNSTAVLKDVKAFTYVGAGTGIPSLDLDSMEGATALDRAAGDIILVFCAIKMPSGAGIQQALPSGFAEIHFANVSADAATRSAWKLADGTETTVPLLVTGSGTNTRANFFAAAFSIVGTPALGETLATAVVTTADPAAQTIHTSEVGDTRIAFVFKNGHAANPGTVFTGYSPQYDRLYSNTTTVRLDSRLQLAVLPPSAPLENITVDMGDNGTNIMQSGYIAVRPSL